jgi:hypothetical protein
VQPGNSTRGVPHALKILNGRNPIGTKIAAAGPGLLTRDGGTECDFLPGIVFMSKHPVARANMLVFAVLIGFLALIGGLVWDGFNGTRTARQSSQHT